MDEKKGLYKVKDLSLAKAGKLRIEWAESRMPVLMALQQQYRKTRPLKGFRIAGCLHVTKETAVLVKTFVAAGAEVSWSGCNPLSTQDDVAAALVKFYGIRVYAIKGEDNRTYYQHLDAGMRHMPAITMDDGADLVSTIHKDHPDVLKAQADLRSAAHARNAAFGDYLPDVDGSFTRKHSRTTSTAPSADSMSFDLDVTQPLFAGGAVTGEFLQAKREWEAARFAYRETSADVRQRLRASFAELLRVIAMVEKGALVPTIDQVMPLKDAAASFMTSTALKRLREMPQYKSTPIIMLTNLGQEEDIAKAKQLGATDYLIKANFTPGQVLEKIQNVSSK